MEFAAQEGIKHRRAATVIGIARRLIPPGSAEAYGFATICVAIASFLHWGLGLFVTEDTQHFTTFYPAVLFAALIGGAGAGIFAALSSGFLAWWAFIPPHFVFFQISSEKIESLIIYLFSSLLIVWAADHYRRLTKRLEDKEIAREAEEKFRKLAVEELAHRLKNKIATIQAVVSFQLRDNPHLRDAIIGRLAALSATDDLILATQGQGAYLRDIFATELRPYEASRATVEGPAIFLPPKLATTMALLIHELSTNAAKYGALSIAAGKVSVRWSVSDACLNIEWRESDGPIVATPIHRGFGMRMLTRALEDFGGTVETLFEPRGLVCKLSSKLYEYPSSSAQDIGPHVKGAPDAKSVAAE